MRKIAFFLVALAFLPLALAAQQSVKPSVGIVAHRGFHRYAGSAENSVSAMRMAFDHDFEGTEFDVQLTQDGVAIVFHDASMQGHVICETPFDTLRQLSAFTLSSGELVPLMTEFLEACSESLAERRPDERHTRLFFEIKPHALQNQRLHLLGQIIEALGTYRLHDEVFFISFDLEACTLLAQLLPDVPVAYLEGDLSPRELHERGISGIDYHWSKFQEHPEWVKEAHDLGMSVNVWTVNKPDLAVSMLKLGVDYITTDYPLDMRSWLEPKEIQR